MTVCKFANKVADELANLGITHVFGLPGGQAMHLMDAVDQHPKLTYVTALHEQAASFMAIGFAREHRTPAACLVTTGPGGTNAITGLAGAWLDSIPVVFISGQFRTETLGISRGIRQSILQQMFPVDLVKPMSKFAKLLDNPESLNSDLQEALSSLTSGRPGPVWLDIPLDMQARMVEETPFNYLKLEEVSLDISQLEELISNSSRPVMLAGHGVRLAGAEAQLRNAVEILGIPLLTSINGMDLIEDNHPLFYGRPNYWGQREANFIIQNADLVISIGAGLHLETTGFNSKDFAREAKLVIVDIDEAETRKSALSCDLSYVVDAKVFLEKIIQTEVNGKRSAWLEYCDAARSKFKFDQFPKSTDLDGLSMHEIIEEISNQAPNDCTVVHGNAGGHFTTAVQCFRVKPGQRLMSSTGIGAMGASIPMAIGASFASPGRKMLVFTGDGGIQFNIQEIATLLGNELPIHLFVFENQGYASLRSTQRRYFEGRLIASSPESRLYLPELGKVISAYGIKVDEVWEQSDIANAISRNLGAYSAVTIFHVDPENPIQPRLGSSMLADGVMVSDPLEDLSPHLSDEEFSKWMLIRTLRK